MAKISKKHEGESKDVVEPEIIAPKDKEEPWNRGFPTSMGSPEFLKMRFFSVSNSSSFGKFLYVFFLLLLVPLIVVTVFVTLIWTFFRGLFKALK